MWWQMIVVTWCVTLIEMSSNIVIPNMKTYYKKYKKIKKMAYVSINKSFCYINIKTSLKYPV